MLFDKFLLHVIQVIVLFLYKVEISICPCFWTICKIAFCKMNFILIYLLGSLLECYGFRTENGYVGQHCRDGYKPVAWWYIYKPPTGVVHPSGQNFSFLTPDTEGRWIQSLYGITEADMLSNTLMPDYKQRSFMDRGSRATIIFESRHGVPGSSARGVVMADENGGFLLTHTVPGFPQKLSKFAYHSRKTTTTSRSSCPHIIL
ncbi:deoxyribonuclease-2-alpha-like [Cydia amplana]|uniref:deoxyribonuclease-2-alpha-like n=1 Tax=Cydia amplana TaxID=1869771 RepID=UPI002FE51351